MIISLTAEDTPGATSYPKSLHRIDQNNKLAIKLTDSY